MKRVLIEGWRAFYQKIKSGLVVPLRGDVQAHRPRVDTEQVERAFRVVERHRARFGLTSAMEVALLTLRSGATSGRSIIPESTPPTDRDALVGRGLVDFESSTSQVGRLTKMGFSVAGDLAAAHGIA